MSQLAIARSLVGLIFAAGSAAALAADDATKEKAGPPATLRELMDSVIDEVQVFAEADPETPAEARVVMRWANNARGSEDGATLLYVYNGCPLAVACQYPWARQLSQDFGALSRDRIVARREGLIIWRPQQSGAKFADIPDAPLPEQERAARLRQMKSLAGQFQSTMLGWKSDNTDREDLRLLPRPLYRYQPTAGQIIDGAVFAFAMGTDPESLLLIEAVNRDGAAVWQYAFARRTSGELEGRHRGQVVWHADRYPAMRDVAKPDFSVGYPIPPDLLPPTDAR